jgi:hypothetical protein
VPYSERDFPLVWTCRAASNPKAAIAWQACRVDAIEYRSLCHHQRAITVREQPGATAWTIDRSSIH